MRVLTVLVYQIYVCSHSVLKEDVSEFCNSVFYCASIIGKSKSKKQTILPKEKKKRAVFLWRDNWVHFKETGKRPSINMSIQSHEKVMGNVQASRYKKTKKQTKKNTQIFPSDITEITVEPMRVVPIRRLRRDENEHAVW